MSEEYEAEDNDYLIAPGSSSLYCQGLGLFSYAQTQVSSAITQLAPAAQQMAQY
jgi:hypothetical protein